MKGRGGFTLIEVLMAIVMLSFGVLVLASTAGGITRMMGNGQRKTKASAIAASRMEFLRNLGNSTAPKCSAGAFVAGSATQPGGFWEQWTIAGAGMRRQVQVIVRYRSGPRAQGDTLNATILC